MIGWTRAKLSDVCTFENGDRGKNYPSRSAFIEAGIPFINAGNILGRELDTSDFNYISEDSYNKLGSGKVLDGDLVFCLRGSLGKFGIVKNIDKAAIASSLVIIRAKESINSEYLAAFLGSDLCAKQISLYENGAAQPNLSGASLKNFEIPLPPLEEQKRIAAILDQADALRRLRQCTIDKLNTLGQSVFYEMFGSGDIQNTAQPLGELIEEFRYGTSNKATDTGYPTLRIPNVIGGGLALSDLKTVPVKPAELNRLKLVSGDVLFVRTNGNPDYVGRSAVFEPELVGDLDFDTDSWIYASYLIRARLRLKELHPTYLHYYLTAPQGRRALRERSKTSAGQFNINTEGLGSIPIFVPEIREQQEFADKVASIRKEFSNYSLSLERFDTFFSSLQQRAFRGEL